MNFFTKKKFLFKLIVSICLCLIIIGFNMSSVLQAATDTSILTDDIEKVEVISKAAVIQNYKEAQPLAWGGQILQPIIELVMSIGDGIMNIIQNSIMGGTDAYIAVDKARNLLLAIIAVILIAVVAIVLFVVGFGGVAAAAAALSTKMTALAAAGGFWGVVGHAALGVGGATLTALKGVILVVSIGTGIITSLSAVSVADENWFPEVTVLPLYSISPEELFRGEILLFDINFFNPKEVLLSDGTESKTYILNGKEITTDEQVYYYVNQQGKNVITSQQSSAYELKNTIAKWYYTFRNLAMVVLMIILVYVGIRMLLSSVASDKAKYKKMLLDWGVALCLVFTIHYIMVFATNLTESVVEMLKSTSQTTSYTEVIDFRDSDHIQDYRDAIEAGGLSPDEFIRSESLSEGAPAIDRLFWPTNLIGHARIQSQQMDGTATYIGYSLCYMILVLYTVYFTFTYAKRLLYITFLTVIAPLVSITYPIDKMNDGKAQAFDIWFKEYIFNLLIQPLHLMLYTVLISMAFEFAGANIIYSIVAIGFMMPAEKFLRKMFNFEKASTPGLLGGAAGAALVMSGLNALSKMGGTRNNKGNGDSNSKDVERSKIRGYDSNSNFDNVMSELQEGSNPLHQRDNNEAARREMLEADEENFGTEEFDAQQYDAMARELNSGQDQEQQYSEDEYRQILMDSGYEGEDLERMMIEGGYGSDEQLAETLEEEPEQQPETLQDESEVEDPEEEIDDLPEELESKPSLVSRAGSAWKKGMEVTGKRAIKNIPNMAGAGLRLAGGLTGATIGLAAGISSGDISKTVQYTTAGAVAGKAVSNMPLNKVKDAIGRSKREQEEFEKDYYGTNYSKHRRQQLDTRFESDSSKRKEYAEELGIDKKYERQMLAAKSIEDMEERKARIKQVKADRKKEIDKVMKQAVEYRKFNVTDDGVIIKAMQIDKNNARNNRASKDKIASAMIASNAKNQKDVDEYIKRLRKQGITENEADRIAKNAKLINPNI